MTEATSFLQSPDPDCTVTGYQTIQIQAPITVTPHVQTGRPITRCCGDPVVSSGRASRPGCRNGSCIFTIRQEICVAVPVTFHATAATDDIFVDCDRASAENLCACCGDAE